MHFIIGNAEGECIENVEVNGMNHARNHAHPYNSWSGCENTNYNKDPSPIYQPKHYFRCIRNQDKVQKNFHDHNI